MHLHALFVLLPALLAALTTSLPTSDPCADDTASLPTSTHPSPLPPTLSLSPPSHPPPIPFFPANLTRRETRVNEPANIVIDVYFNAYCSGGGIDIAAAYSVSYLNRDLFQSYTLSRHMLEGEQLDFSGPPGCETFLAWRVGVSAGYCWQLTRPVGCLRFWHW